ncbi:hypothetical protein [Puniceicoccus vermicola]|uniref:Uncharacterized protein n=1 Tax=Puniceicoccus vermicola TaxID=388746 RepID=A0A7X1AZ18_9BACT|nr:hypothetical protein [Puniceicoccus vermicola]MBC2602606.1 hypothetical protein [Puniceicoccus vermicola]
MHFLGIFLATAIGVGALSAQEVSGRHEGVRVLSNEQITLEVMDPESPERYNTGTRFMPLMILRATRDGEDFFYSPVDHDPNLDGAGLAMDFDATNPFGPPGFYQAEMDEGFMKVGVGVLRRSLVRWSFYRPKEVIQLAKTTIDWREDGASLEQECGPVNGYAYTLGVELLLVEDRIELNYRLTNTGEKLLGTEFYVHTFFKFGEGAVGPDYSVEFPYPINPYQFKKSDRIGSDFITFNYELTKPTTVKFWVPESAENPNVLKVTNTNGQFIESRFSGQPVGRVSVHASSRYICPEQFILLLIKPGGSKEWSVRYRLGREPGVEDGETKNNFHEN